MHPEQTREEIVNELSLLDVFEFFVKAKKVISLSVLGCCFLGIVYFLFFPNRYEATATIQMATVAGQPVEAAAVLLEKIKLPLYFSAETWKKCDTEEELKPRRKTEEKIKPILNRNAPLITFSITDDSPKEASECLEAVILDIRGKQSALAKPLVDMKKNNIYLLKEKLELAENISKILNHSKLNNLNFRDEQLSAASLMLATHLSYEGQIRDLRNQINDLQIQISPPQTRETQLASPIYSPNQPTNKSPLLISGLSLLMGFFIGLAVSLVKMGVRSKKP